MDAFKHPLCSRLTATWLSGEGLNTHAEAYAARLTSRGYRPATIAHYLSSLAHFTHWCELVGHELASVDDRQVDTFIRSHLPKCECASRCSRLSHNAAAALSHFFEGQRSWRRASHGPSALPSDVMEELSCYASYLLDVRGLALLTRGLYARHARDFLVKQFGSRPIRLCQVLPADVARFVRQHAAGWKPASIKALNTSLRSYFAFKASCGEQTTLLSAALPNVPLWRMSQLPKMLAPEDIDRLLRSYDRSKACGKRDYAIARCLIDLGLRRVEVSRLKLGDVNWREGVLHIASKGQRTDILPLPAATGEAIADYVRHGRPITTLREIFVRHNAPRNEPINVDLIRGAIRPAATRCGMQDRIAGTHILRHTLAGRLVQSGTPLKEIADLLRHRDLDTTTIYAKVDLPALARVCQPWPRRPS